MPSEMARWHGRSFRLPGNEPATLTIDFASRKALRCITDLSMAHHTRPAEDGLRDEAVF
jgi:hypothetical protein